MANTASRASRPAGGACGAPGPRARHVDRGSYASKLTLAGDRQTTIEHERLDKRSFHISYMALIARARTRLDDSLDVVAAHGTGGATGALLTGVFADPAWSGGPSGWIAGHGSQLGIQGRSASSSCSPTAPQPLS